MGNKLNPNETVSFEEVLMSNVYTQEAMINLLVKKGLIKREEILKEIMELRIKQRRSK